MTDQGKAGEDPILDTPNRGTLDCLPTSPAPYIYTEDMREISGLGSGYERTCKDMVLAGVQWFKDHPTANPSFSGFEGIFGFQQSTNKDAEELEEVMLVAAKNDATGAMMQMCTSHVFFIHRYGWEAYCKEMKK